MTGMIKPEPVRQDVEDDSLPYEALIIPHEQRVLQVHINTSPIQRHVNPLQFLDMLREHKVTAFSSWDKVEPELKKDIRYRFLQPRDRKPAYEQFFLLLEMMRQI